MAYEAVESVERVTQSDEVSTGVDAFSLAMILLAVCAAIFCVVLTIRAYMPCPWLEEWGVVADLKNGARPWSWGWLWGQNNEHRTAMVRLLLWLDWAAFGGKRVSLFAEMYLIQAAHLAVICYCIERFSGLQASLRRMLQGVFGFCLFHPYQAQNFTWAFQISFVTPFAIGTAALLLVAHFEHIPARWLSVAVACVGLAPLLAAMNLASGLLLGPAVVCIAGLKRLPMRPKIALGALSLSNILVYVYGYRQPTRHTSPLLALAHPVSLIHYVLTMLGASWQFFASGLLSLIVLAGCTFMAMRHRESISNFEWFCFAQCGLILATATLTACGRLQFGVLQAGEGRYQTAAVIYWASLFSLSIVATWRWWPELLGLTRMGVVLIVLTSGLGMPSLWTYYAQLSNENRKACTTVMNGRYSASDVKQLNFFADNPIGEIRQLYPMKP